MMYGFLCLWVALDGSTYYANGTHDARSSWEEMVTQNARYAMQKDAGGLALGAFDAGASSPAVDIMEGFLNIYFDTGYTSTDTTADSYPADAGYHYGGGPDIRTPTFTSTNTPTPTPTNTPTHTHTWTPTPTWTWTWTPTWTWTNTPTATDTPTATFTPTNTPTPTPADTTPPSCAIISPTTGEAIAGIEILEATAEDALSGIEEVAFYWDVNDDGPDASEWIGGASSVGGNKYRYTWNTVDAEKGYHPLIVACTDSAQNTATASVLITVATAYYVSTATGDNDNDGSAGSPFATIGRAVYKVENENSIGATFIEVATGIYREKISLYTNGVTFDALSESDLPTISGATPILPASWSNESGNVWIASVTPDPVLQVFIGNPRGILESGTPELDAAGEFYWNNGNLYVYSAGAAPTNVEIAVRDNCATWRGIDATTFRGLRFVRSTGRCLNVAGDIERPTVESATVENCWFQQAIPSTGPDNAYIVVGSNAEDVTIRDCTFGNPASGTDEAEGPRYAAANGIISKGTRCRFIGNTIWFTANDNFLNSYGIRLLDATDAVEVSGNTIYHAGSHGIYVDADTVADTTMEVSGNVIWQCGQAGVSVYKARARDGVGGGGVVLIHGNEISYCNRTGNTATAEYNAACGIHVNDGTWAETDPQHPIVKVKVYENTVHDCISMANKEDGGGIGIDYNANGVEAYRNWLYDNGGRGIYVFNADDCKVYSNVCYGNDAGITVTCNDVAETAIGNWVYNNTLYQNYNGSPGNNYNCELIVNGYNSNCTGTVVYNNLMVASDRRCPRRS